VLFLLLESVRWFHSSANFFYNDFWAYPNNYYSLNFQQRWVSDVNMLSACSQVISTPNNLKAALASELSGVKITDTLPPDIYCLDLKDEDCI